MAQFSIRGLERDTRKWVKLELTQTDKGWQQREIDTQGERRSGWDRDYVSREKMHTLRMWFECDFATFHFDDGEEHSPDSPDSPSFF